MADLDGEAAVRKGAVIPLSGPKVSVVMTFFNEPPHKVRRSVGSILVQTLPEFEFIVVPGNPTNTAAIREIEAMAHDDPRLSILPVPASSPMGTCLNLAIRKASAPYIALQEADDASRPGRIAEQMFYMESHPEVDVLGTALAYIDERDGREIVRRSYPPGTAAFRRYAAIAHPTVLVRREVYDRCGFYDESGEWRHCPDYELWLRWLTQGVRFHTIPDLLFDYYQSDENGRNRNVKPTLRSVVRLKRMYRDRLGFTVGDRAYLALEKTLLLFPGRWIGRLFYLWIRFSSPAIRKPRREGGLPNVCVVSQLFNPYLGGLARQSVLLTGRLCREGVDLFVIARRLSGAPDGKRLPDVEVIEVPALFPNVHILDEFTLRNVAIPVSFSVLCLAHLIRRRKRYDLVHFHGGGIMLWICLPVLKAMGKRVLVKVARVQGTEVGSLSGRYLGLGRLLARLSSRADAFIGISGEIREGLRRDGVPERKIHAITNFVEIDVFRPPGEGEKEKMRARLGYGGDPVVIFSGHLSTIKGGDILVSAWAIVCREFPGAKLLFLGEGPLRGAMEESLNRDRLADSVRFAGRVRDVEEHLRAADVYILPSRMEGLSNSLLEAMASGLPVVATSVGGAPDVVRDGENGLLVAPEDPSSLARAVTLLLRDPGLRRRLGDAAHATIRDRFSLDAVVRRYLVLYGEMMDPSTPGFGKHAGEG